ncbi:MAG: preprotein translocase subunit YajC [Clostridia bacterium]|nr:preprotein translocase subunit YajC [Clostridia bacterium]MBQ7094616.1 preprotein translocase subunit YajC [Clostridia bacterium]
MPQETIQMLMSLGWIVLTFVLFYFVLIRPQKKREKEEKAMLNALKVGDNVVTIGGITGKIISIKDDLLVIETGADRVKLNFQKWAIRSVEDKKA